MRKYFYIGLGGISGAILRYVIREMQMYDFHGHIPLNTLIINVTGSFLLALIMTVALEVWKFDAAVRLGITTGFLGAYTTFSTLCKEIAVLIYRGDYLSAAIYMGISVVISLAGVYLGIVLAREVVSKLIKKDKNEAKNTNAEIRDGVK